MKIVAIAPYPGLKNLIENVINEEQDFNVQIELGDLHDGVAIAMEAEKKGADVIISRGGTAELIQKKVNIPVIEIELSEFDLLRTITLIKTSPLKKAIIGFSKVIENAETLCHLLDINISTYTINDKEEVIAKLQQLQTEQYQLIIGDAVTVRHAQELGMNGVLLTSGKESVLNAFREAKKIGDYYKPLIRSNEVPLLILEQLSSAFMLINKDGELVYHNKSANELIRSLEKDIVEKVSEQIFMHQNIENIIEINNQLWKVQGEQVNIEEQSFAFVLFIFLTDNVKSSRGIDINPPPHQISLHNMNLTLNDVMKKAQSISLLDENVLLTGERGTEKDQLASYIHSESTRGTNGFITIDCSLVNEDIWHKILDKNSSENVFKLTANGTIYLKNVEHLSIVNQRLLYTYLIENKELPMIIASASEDISEYVDNGNFEHDLYYLLSELSLPIPPLRDREVDFESLIQVYINTFNFEYGKQISGIRPNALHMMSKYPWPGNLDELIRVIKETVISIEGPFIKEEDIKHALRTRVMEKATSSTPILNIQGTLKDIENEIIVHVLHEEGGNHSKAAKRLDINRSTLWRKLKEINSEE